MRIKCTLITDGSSDKILQHPIQWLFRQHFPGFVVELNWGPVVKSGSLTQKIADNLRLFPCDLLLIHRDAERESYDHRLQEITNAVGAVDQTVPKHIPVIPCRMSEAWMLIDESAIRSAANNPNGSTPLNLPSLRRLESLTDPKADLKRLLKRATELSGRRLKGFNESAAIHRVADLIEDYSALRRLPYFQNLEAEIENLRLHLAV